MNKNKKAFTLLELIVSIIILAILGTIAFISMQGYSAISRDSVRISDVSSIKTALELFYLGAGKYPEPTNSYNIYHGGNIVWMQGDFGKETFMNLSRLDRIPQDPLVNQLYTYSITYNKQEYELAGIIENTDISYISKTFAGDKIATAMVVGNYNGQTLKTNSGTNCEILSLPSIISGDYEINNDLPQIIENEKLVYDGFNNLPIKFSNTKFKIDGGFNFKTNQLVVYSDSNECKSLYQSENIETRINFVRSLQDAYSGTILAGEGKIKAILDIDSDDKTQLALMGVNIVNNNLGGNLSNKITDVSYLNCLSSSIQGENFSGVAYDYPNILNGETGTGTKVIGLSNGGSKIYSANISCNDGNVAIYNEIENIICDTYSYSSLICPSGYSYNSSNKNCEEYSYENFTPPSVCKVHTQMTQIWNPDLIVDATVPPGTSYHGTRISGVVYNPFHYTTSDFRIKFDANCIIYEYQKQSSQGIVNIPPGSSQTYWDTLENNSEPGCSTGYTTNGTQCVSNNPINSSTPTCSSEIFNPTTNNCKISNCN